MTALEMKNLVRGLNPIMGAYAYIDTRKIKIWKAQSIEEKSFCEENPQISIENKKQGEVIISDSKKGLYIKTKRGILQVIEMQGENSKRMAVGDYLRGNKIEEGAILS